MFGSLLDQFVSGFFRVNVLSFFEFDADQSVSGFVRVDAVGLMNFSTAFYSYFVFNPKDSRSKIYLEVYDGIVSILNLETRCSSSAASQIQWWVPTVLFFF